MKIKKFICRNCGAPKINEYKSPYVMCDYCGSFVDIDFSTGMDFWQAKPEKTAMYALRKLEFQMGMQKYQSIGDRDNYMKLQKEYWDYYYKCFPEYLPPSVDTDFKYKIYLDVCADSSTYYAFDNSWNQKQHEMTILQQALTYFQQNGQWKVYPEPFFKLAEFYINILKDSFKEFYSKPQYEIMNELLPQAVHLKMKMSQFVQVWEPYLTEQDSDKFLKVAGFSLEYVDITPPKMEESVCEHCGSPVSVPEGAFRVFCESCRKTTAVKKVFACMSCGAENPVPDNPYKPIDCTYCGTENRLIKAWFG